MVVPDIEVYEQALNSSYAGPTVENNSISLSANRIALNAIGISLKIVRRSKSTVETTRLQLVTTQ